MKANRLHPQDNVEVKVEDADGKIIFMTSSRGFHNVEEAIAAAYARMTDTEARLNRRADESLEENPSFFHYYHNPDAGDNLIENYTFTVINQSQGTSARYRVNAGGHVRLLS